MSRSSLKINPMNKTSYHHGDLKNALIKAGAELLVEEGAKSFSMRQVAARVGVSHSAPYAHFADKEALIAAITTTGFEQLYQRMEAAISLYQDRPAELLVEVACAYVQFAQELPVFYKLMFSGILEHEQAHPDFVHISKASFSLLVELVRRCQASSVLPPGPEDVLAVSVWSLVHGFTSLLLEGQITHTILERYPLRELVRQAIAPFLK
jgi:AcrR family transcriptional regulator